jgi:hypothetical protein
MIQQFCAKVIGIQFDFGCNKCSSSTMFCTHVENMGDKLLEKRMNIKFLVKLEKRATGINL